MNKQEDVIELMMELQELEEAARSLQYRKREANEKLVEALVELRAFHCFTVNKAAVRRVFNKS